MPKIFRGGQTKIDKAKKDSSRDYLKTRLALNRNAFSSQQRTENTTTTRQRPSVDPCPPTSNREEEKILHRPPELPPRMKKSTDKCPAPSVSSGSSVHSNEENDSIAESFSSLKPVDKAYDRTVRPRPLILRDPPTSNREEEKILHQPPELPPRMKKDPAYKCQPPPASPSSVSSNRTKNSVKNNLIPQKFASKKDDDLKRRQEHAANLKVSITKQIALKKSQLHNQLKDIAPLLKSHHESTLDHIEKKYHSLLDSCVTGNLDGIFKKFLTEIQSYTSFVEKQSEFIRSYITIIQEYKNSSLFLNDERFKGFLNDWQEEAIKSLTEVTDEVSDSKTQFFQLDQKLVNKFDHLKQQLLERVVHYAIYQKERELQNHVKEYVQQRDYNSAEWQLNIMDLFTTLSNLEKELIAAKNLNFEQRFLERTRQIKEFINKKVIAYVKNYYIARLECDKSLVSQKIKSRPPILGYGFKKGMKNLWENICCLLNHRAIKRDNKYYSRVVVSIRKAIEEIRLLQDPRQIKSLANSHLQRISEDEHSYLGSRQ